MDMITDGLPPDAHGKELWEKLNDKRRAAAERYEKLVAETELNLAFLSGNQWTTYSNTDGITPIRNTTNEVREVDNRILPAYLRMMWELYGDKPTIVAYEGGMEAKDSEAAQAVVQICDYLNENNGWREARLSLGSWLMVAGTAYMMPYWRRNARYTGKKPQNLYVAEPVKTEKGMSHLLTVPVDTYDGDIGFEVLSPLCSYCFPLDASRWKDVNEFMTVSLVSLENLSRRVGRRLKADELEAQGGDTVNFEALSRINRYVSDDLGYSADMTAGDVRYLEIQYWQRPSPMCPKGRYIYAYGSHIEHDGPLPYLDIARAIDPGDNFNLTMGIIPQYSYVVPGMLHPPAPITSWRPAQVRINSLLTDQTQNRHTVGRNKLIIERGSLDDNAFTDEHGELIEVRPGMTIAPQYLQASPLAGIEQEMDRAEYSLQQATGQSLAVQGKNDTQVRSAMHFEMLRSSAAVVNWMMEDQAEANDSLVAKFVVQMARERWSEDRTRDVIGHDRETYYLAFRDSVVPVDVRMRRGSAMSRNYILREETLEKYLQYGLFNADMPPQTRRMFLRATELGYMFDAGDPDAVHRNRAGYENLRMAMGESIEPLEEEDHLVHIEEHNRWFHSPSGRAADDKVQATVLAHIDEHRTMYSNQIAPQQNIPQTPIHGLGAISLTSPGRMAPSNSNMQAAGQQPAQQTGAMV